MKKINIYFSILAGLIICSSTSFAQQKRIDAAGICMGMGFAFSSDTDDCVEAIRGAYYIEQNALQVCKSLPFGDDKIECLSAIANKTYTDSEVQLCRSKVFSDDRNSCLENNGQPYSSGYSDSERLEAARILALRLKQELSNGQLIRAISTLNDLLWVLQ